MIGLTSSRVPVDTPMLAKRALPSPVTVTKVSKATLHLAMVLALQAKATTSALQATEATRELQATEAIKELQGAMEATSVSQATESVLRPANSNLATAKPRIRIAAVANTSSRFATPSLKGTPTRGQLAMAPGSRLLQNQQVRAISTLMMEGSTATTCLRPKTTNILITSGEQMTELKQLCAFLIVCLCLGLRRGDRPLCMCEIAVKRLK